MKPSSLLDMCSAALGQLARPGAHRTGAGITVVAEVFGAVNSVEARRARRDGAGGQRGGAGGSSSDQNACKWMQLTLAGCTLLFDTPARRVSSRGNWGGVGSRRRNLVVLLQAVQVPPVAVPRPAGLGPKCMRGPEMQLRSMQSWLCTCAASTLCLPMLSPPWCRWRLTGAKPRAEMMADKVLKVHPVLSG